jgi:hypothetical protein
MNSNRKIERIKARSSKIGPLIPKRSNLASIKNLRAIQNCHGTIIHGASPGYEATDAELSAIVAGGGARRR